MPEWSCRSNPIYANECWDITACYSSYRRNSWSIFLYIFSSLLHTQAVIHWKRNKYTAFVAMACHNQLWIMLTRWMLIKLTNVWISVATLQVYFDWPLTRQDEKTKQKFIDERWSAWLTLSKTWISRTFFVL